MTTFKYLGVVFDNFMTWKALKGYVCKKVVCTVVFWAASEVSGQKRCLY